MQLQKPGCRRKGFPDIERKLLELGFERLMEDDSPRHGTTYKPRVIICRAAFHYVITVTPLLSPFLVRASSAAIQSASPTGRPMLSARRSAR